MFTPESTSYSTRHGSSKQLGFMMSSVQQRKNEILAKRAKLAELKKQRELRQKEFTTTRNSVGDASEVRPAREYKITRI